jgi:hypothetical protein
MNLFFYRPSDSNSLLKEGYSLPFQRIKGADAGAKRGNPKGAPVFARQSRRQGPRCIGLFTARSTLRTLNLELLVHAGKALDQAMKDRV